MNVPERAEAVEWNMRWFSPFHCCPVNCQCLRKKTVIEKKIVSDFLHKNNSEHLETTII